MRFSIATAWIDPAELPAIAREADRLGYHALSISDHVVNLETLKTPYPYTADGERRWNAFDPWVDPMVAIGALGAITERLRFFTNVYVLPMRDPFTVAKTVATASIFTGGRVSLGVGMGWCEDEFDLIGQPFRRRGARADEMLDLLATLWQGGWVEHHGEFYDFAPVKMRPVPATPIPIYVGGFSKPALRRAARNDGWISDLHTLKELEALIKEVRAYRAEAGRASEPFRILGFSCSDAWGPDGFRAMRDIGLDVVSTMPGAFYGVDMKAPVAQKIDAIKRFADDVIAKI